MTLYEATMLAGIPNAPSVYAPTQNPDLTKAVKKGNTIYGKIRISFGGQKQIN